MMFWLTKQTTPKLEHLRFDTRMLESVVQNSVKRVYNSINGDTLIVQLFRIPPDFPSLTSVSDLIPYWQNRLIRSGNVLVQVGTNQIGQVWGVNAIIKQPQQPTGMTYIATVTVPFERFSFVVKIVCSEYGTTGTREAVVAERKLGTLQSMADLEQLIENVNSDAPEFDQEFPDHPLSRARKLLLHVGDSLEIDPKLNARGYYFFSGVD
jgi:hypothetical protein